MKNDVISKVARSDPLIVALGNLSMKRNIGNKVMRRYNVSSDMRLAARCLIELRELQEGEDAKKNLTWYEALHPDQYDNIVKAVFAVCRENFNEAEGEDDDDGDDLEAPSNAIKLSYDIARLVSVKVTSCIVEGNKALAEKTRKETKRFMEMFKYNWSTDVKKRARHVLRERKLNQKVELPDPNDIAKLANHMQKRMQQSVRPKTYDEYKELQYDTLARLIAFNRRRPGELQVMRLAQYDARQHGSADVHQSILEDLNEFEKEMVNNHDLIEIRGKVSIWVVLLTDLYNFISDVVRQVGVHPLLKPV